MPLGFMQDREQHTRRKSVQKIDDYGRIWHCEVDLFDEQFSHCGIPTLDGKYRPPIDIPVKYMKKHDPKQPFRFVLNIALWKRDWAARMVEWRARLAEAAQQMYPNNYGAMLTDPSPELLREVGSMPIPLEFIEAIEVGNKWALGIPRSDGTYYPRPKWATDDLMARYALLKQSYWAVDAAEGAEFAAPDPAKYADEDDDTVPTVVDDDENENVVMTQTRPARRRR